MPQLVSGQRYAMFEPTDGVPAERPELAKLASGGFISTWGAAGSIRAQLFDAAGVALGAPFVISESGHQIDVVATATGGFVAAWEDSWQGVVVGIFDAQGNATATTVIADGPTYGRYQQPSIAVLASGNFVVAFSAGSGDANGEGVRAQMFNSTGQKIGPEFNVNSVTIGSQRYPLTESLPDGGFLISWADDVNSAYGAQIYDAAGNKVGGQIDIAPGAEGAFDIAVLKSGNIIAVWPNAAGELKGQLYTSAGAKTGVEFSINAPTPDAEIVPDVVALPSGGFAVAWRAPTPGINFSEMGDIRAQLFDSTGLKVGEEFVVSTGSLGQSEPQLAAFGSNDLAVTYIEFTSSGESTLRMRLLYSAQAGTAGADVLTSDDDQLYGMGGDDRLTGGAGANTLDGGAGNDRLYGGAGADTLTGGTGADSFYFDAPLGAGVDRITDFAAVDTIQLDRAVFSAVSAGVLTNSALRVGATATTADQRVIYDQATGRLFYDSDGSGSAAAVLFATGAAGKGLSAADFIAYD